MRINIYNESSNSVKNKEINKYNNNKITTLESFPVSRNPNSNNELADKNYIVDELNKNTILQFNQTLENYLKISVENDVFDHAENDKIQILDTTSIKYPNLVGSLLQRWNMKFNDKQIKMENCKSF